MIELWKIKFFSVNLSIISLIFYNFVILKHPFDKEKVYNSKVILLLKIVVSLYQPFIEWIFYILEKFYTNVDQDVWTLYIVRLVFSIQWGYELSCGKTEHGSLKF